MATVIVRTDAVEADFGPWIPKPGEIGFNILQVWGTEGTLRNS
ncbi:MAG: hypothetical protein AAF827_02465 [Cyanobacteria bacterium P01_D01_bin.6]